MEEMRKCICGGCVEASCELAPMQQTQAASRTTLHQGVVGEQGGGGCYLVRVNAGVKAGARGRGRGQGRGAGEG